MKAKSAEFEKFDTVMSGLLAVPYSELQKELEKEERAKARKRSGLFRPLLPALLCHGQSALLSATYWHRQAFSPLVLHR
jgi:hypothetical protein